MPTYGYVCTSCNQDFEFMQSIKADPLKVCPDCQKETLKRDVGGGIGLAFHGSGFYINDSKSKSEGCCPCNKSKGSCQSKSEG